MNDYTTKTASLLAAKIKGTKADVTYLNIDGTPFSKVVSDNVPESPTNKDLWKYAVTTDDEGVVTITDDVTVDYTEVTDAQKDILKTTVKVIDNKVLDANDVVLMNWDTKNFTNDNNSDTLNIFGGTYEQKAPITEWNSDLSSLTNGKGMFGATALTSFSGDLSSLTNGFGMFYNTTLESFNVDLPSLTNGECMFMMSRSLTSFSGDMPNLLNGREMFAYCTALESFSGDLSSLTNGSGMFMFSISLTSFSGDLSSLTNGNGMFVYNVALESFSGNLSSLIYGSRMFVYTTLTSWDIDLPSLTNGNMMFHSNPLTSFDSDLPSLTDGDYMFYGTALESFSGDLSSLINGSVMFHNSALKSFSGDLSSLTNGEDMFNKTALTSWNIDLPSLIYGGNMFYNTALESFSGDLSSLTYGYGMFDSTHARTYNIHHYAMVDGVRTQVQTEVTATGLKSFTSNLSSLTNGYHMFGNSAENASPLNEESIFFIAETINDINGLGLTGNNGQLWLGYDATTITDTSKIMKYCDKIANKGWTVYLNGALQVANNGAIETISLTNEDGSAIPYYYKPVQVTDEEIAEYIDANNNYYIIVGGQHVFGDDISTYGMFTSYDHAKTEIIQGLGLTTYEKPAEEETHEKSAEEEIGTKLLANIWNKTSN